LIIFKFNLATAFFTDYVAIFTGKAAKLFFKSNNNKFMAGDKRTTTFTFLAEPGDVNFGGKVHGGAVMKWIDQVAYACASAWCRRYCVTVYVGGIHFLKSIQIGHTVKLEAAIIYTGNSSMHIAVDVWSAPLWEDDMVKNTHCVIVFVALDQEGNKVNVPKWIPQTAEDKTMEAYALRLMERRKLIEDDDVMRDLLNN
jgi:acyl-CoA hydrolase